METNVSTNPAELTEAEKIKKKARRKEKGMKTYQLFLLQLLILVLIVWALFFFIIGVTRMPSGDMFPRVASGDLVLYYRLDKRMKFGDVVVYQKVDSSGEKQTMISRVIAGPGDTVTFTEDGAVIVNGNHLSEPDIYYHGTQYRGETAPTYPIVLGEDECFVLGDRRDQAYDSRTFGPVKTDEILGTVITIARRTGI